MHKLKRPDGTKYKGNLYKTVKGSLTSNGIFSKTNGDCGEPYWVVNKVLLPLYVNFRNQLLNLRSVQYRGSFILQINADF